MPFSTNSSRREATPSLTVNGRNYEWPKRPTVIVRVDGCDPAYLAAASATGAVPAIDRMRREGFAATALAVIPTFTNPNNVSIVCGVPPSVHGVPPSVHGVSGNFHIDRDTGPEIMMNDATPMRAPTTLAAFSKAGAVVARKGVALGACAVDHDLSQLAGKRLRSHGGQAEQAVPLILSHPLRPGFAKPDPCGWRNFDIFDVALNGVETK